MLISIISVLLGFVVLIWSADRFITGAASIAQNLGMSKMLIGLTIVAFGTSAPEIMVSLFAALEGAADLAVGNALGSNIANMSLVLGVTALIAAIPVKKALIQSELPLMAGAMILAGYVLHDLQVSLLDTVYLMIGLAIFIAYLVKDQKTDHIIETDEEEVEQHLGLSLPLAWLNLVGGLLLLLLSADILVDGARGIAVLLGVPELIIGVTIVALGTSLPELAASVASALKGHHDIAFGNIIGSNIFNLLVVMAMPGFVATIPLDNAVFNRDYIAMVLIAALWVILTAIAIIRHKPFGKIAGSLLVLAYGLYYVVLAQQL